jgi:hypothetical protein
MEAWNNGCPVFQYSIIPVFLFISILIRQGNRKEDCCKEWVGKNMNWNFQ